MPTAAHGHQVLREVLAESKHRGFLGPGPVEEHITHAHAFGQVLTGDTHSVLDLGSGGGVPGLVLFVERPLLGGALLDASAKRCDFLREALRQLRLQDRVEIWEGRAETLAHDRTKRATMDVVVSRSFGPPAHAVECGIGFLKPGGRMVISEPPTPRSWPIDQLRALGIAFSRRSGVAILDLVEDVPSSLPRRTKLQVRAPLFDMG